MPAVLSKIWDAFKKFFTNKHVLMILKAGILIYAFYKLQSYIVDSVPNSQFLNMIEEGQVDGVSKSWCNYYFSNKKAKVLCTSCIGLLTNRIVCKALNAHKIPFDSEFMDSNVFCYLTSSITLIALYYSFSRYAPQQLYSNIQQNSQDKANQYNYQLQPNRRKSRRQKGV
jgi:hypothetical protein